MEKRSPWDLKEGAQDQAPSRGAGRIKRPERERTGSSRQNGGAQDLFCRMEAHRINTAKQGPRGSKDEKEQLSGSKEKFVGLTRPIGAWQELQAKVEAAGAQTRAWRS